MRPGTAEVLYNITRGSNPIQSAVANWAASPVHHGILSNRSYGRIGCAEAADGDTHWLACVLTFGPLPVGYRLHDDHVRHRADHRPARHRGRTCPLGHRGASAPRSVRPI